MTRARTKDACAKQMTEELRASAWGCKSSVDMATTERVAREGRAHLATLSDERRAMLEGEWS